MHLTYYKLSADPFRLSPDPRFCFPHRTYRKAMTYMRHALQRAEGFIVITGQPGMGKTTLINDLFRGISSDQINIARLVSTQLVADDLLRLVAYELDLDPAGIDKASVLNRVGQFLKQQHREGRRTLLVVDEAQDVTGEALEELRLLTNLQVDGQQLLQIFLVGQEELRDLVSAPTLVQLHQRVIAAAHIDPLSGAETREYIKHRLRRVGWEGDPLISNQAYTMIHRFSRGIPRQINQICSRLLLHGSIEERHRLGLQDLQIVIDELYGEMLLPAGVQEIADTVVWSLDGQEETYDERPLSRSETPAMDATSRNNTTTAAAGRMKPAASRHQPAPAGNTGSTGGGRAVDSQRDPGTVANTAVATNTAADTTPVTHASPAPAAVPDRRIGRVDSKRNPLRVVAVTLLIGGLLAALLFTMNSETGIRVRDKLADLIPSGNWKQFTATVLPAPEPVAIPEQPANNIPAEPAPQPATATDTATVPAEVIYRENELPEEIDAGTEPAAMLVPLSSLESDLTENGLQVERLEDDRLKVNLNNAGLFEFNSTELSETSSTELKRLADILRKHDDARIRVVGHTDSSGDPRFNLALSQVRAKVVADYLTDQGLSSDHIRSEGRGDRDTRNEAATRDRPDLRRRIEIYLSPLQDG